MGELAKLGGGGIAPRPASISSGIPPPAIPSLGSCAIPIGIAPPEDGTAGGEERPLCHERDGLSCAILKDDDAVSLWDFSRALLKSGINNITTNTSKTTLPSSFHTVNPLFTFITFFAANAA
jgi:hypothetical protein